MTERVIPGISFTKRENLYEQVSQDRFMTIVMQPNVDIHELKEDSNSFGEYLVVTLSFRDEQPKRLLTFWDLIITITENVRSWIVGNGLKANAA